MTFRSFAAAAISISIVALPVIAWAQTSPNSQVVITTVLAPGVSQPSNAPIVTVTATAPAMAGYTNNTTGGTLGYASGFTGETRGVTFVPGSYSVTASTNSSGYYFHYSNTCSGFTRLSGEIVSCVITLSNTPPTSPSACIPGYYGNPGCPAPVVPYQGSYGQYTLACNPSYQTVAAGQPATFTATGGSSNAYTWTTTDRTTLNIGASYSTVFQSTGVQTVMVNNGIQTANCTINVVAGVAGAITYPGTPTITSNFIPAFLPNTGFGPQDSAVLAFALVLLIGAGIYFAPYVKRAISVTLG
ncbi:hypothetical protein A2419_00670 [Candidatus Adlerbacteria bacterium RIFOXYC1_FULL_48_26]|uniref:Ig-like domain-containing protein n=1 Tax=Candidatus Adlerbacteria bacterium RIFOXYC1_FULL_48_26 TaxID=1797247 RepID=A0A1F4Y4Y9_9BACT|nr:MAG: hypothetical protein A2419_00670 [Candidatus Adlerbacteria bacterium RIFOXYC1_FULL_48_26]OGC94014.1 MAG: hypothetical protein A2389_03500 [Candidatus Adlerbacteria bacterium RIFOXYB1_FULL_48_10]OGC96574.1 MAG: hypothetical protein A2590_00160 [Candidatus Adlerbacteria bacterium RIFOXYD1_FULL_48_8]